MHHSRRTLTRGCLLLGAVFAGCSEATAPAPELTPIPIAETRVIQPPVLPRLMSSPPLTPMCGPTVEYVLWANARDKPGRVLISNDANKLYITYEITEDHWYISDTRVAVTRSIHTIPRRGDNPNMPNPWAFPYSGAHQPVVTSYTYALPLGQLNVTPGTNVVIAAMAGLVHPKTASYEGPWEWMTAWGLGNFQGNNAETFHNYTIEGCGAVAPPPANVSGGVITITFDDGWRTTYTLAYPVLKEFGLVGNIAVNPVPVDGGWSGYLTVAMINEMHAAGWSVVSHSMSHADLTTLTAAQLEAELSQSKAWIQAKGYRGSDVFIVPFHSWGARERAAIERHYSAARGFSANQFFPAVLEKAPVTRRYDITGYEPEYAPFTTPAGRAETMTYVERAMEENEFIDIFFHQLTPEQVPAFRELISQIARYKDNVRGYAEIF